MSIRFDFAHLLVIGILKLLITILLYMLYIHHSDECSINPTRSFGPSLVAVWAKIPGVYYHQQYIFWIGPLFGAGIAAAIYEYGSLKPENFAGARDMDTAIFEAAKKRKIKKKDGKV